MTHKGKVGWLFLLGLIVLPLVFGLACNDTGNDSIGQKVDRAIGDAVESAPQAFDNATDSINCLVQGEGGAWVRAANCNN